MSSRAPTKKRARSIWALIAMGVLATGLSLVSSQPASAGGSCTLGCSETHNTSSLSVLAGRNWGNPYGQTRWIAPGGKTPQKQDWDAFRVDAGYCYHVLWYTYGVPDRTTNYNQINRGEAWIQVHNYETAVVQRQSTSSC